MLKKLIKILLLFFICAMLLAIIIFPRHYLAPIIAYHSVNPVIEKERNRLIVTPDTFERQMRFLQKHHYNVILVEELARLTKEKKRIPHKTLAITFDDGYKDNYTYAFPILKKYNIPATIFLIINEIGRRENDRLNWQQILTMQESGLINFGSHCLGPEPLVNIKSDALLRKEIFDSKKILEGKLNKQIKIFSYPGGFFNDRIRQLVKEAGYDYALTTNPGRKVLDNDIFALKRIRISETGRNLFTFFIQVSGYYNFIRETQQNKK
jgi:peptidoglycan/xylan/chitin deacetylase (PgdA/CDA1 family)